jgi:hypothetical protein
LLESRKILNKSFTLNIISPIIEILITGSVAAFLLYNYSFENCTYSIVILGVDILLSVALLIGVAKIITLLNTTKGTGELVQYSNSYGNVHIAFWGLSLL